MIFSSIFFVFAYLPIVLILYYLVPFKFKNLVLLLVSLVFLRMGRAGLCRVDVVQYRDQLCERSGTGIFYRRGEMRKAKYACIVTAAINLGV